MKNLSESRVIEFLGWLTADIPELHAVEAPKLLDSWKRYLARVRPVEPWGTWQQRAELAKHVKAGDRWIQIKSGRVAVVQGPLGETYQNCVVLMHENGNKTHKWRSYFGQQFTPESPPQHGEKP